MNQGWTVDDAFAPQLVSSLREEFVSRFDNPLEISADRFIWDYWLVPDQYALMRTTAEAFFAPATYQLLEEQVLEWAATLGCRSCSPMWLSYYVDGHAQELHTDAPHGPFAFVLSLTDFESRRFTGGETQLLKQETVLRNFWEDAGTAKEVNQLFDFIEPLFGRLTVFDGRIPHGVRQVRGVRDPREGRLVVHGWFTVRDFVLSSSSSFRLPSVFLPSSLPSLSGLPRADTRCHSIQEPTPYFEGDGVIDEDIAAGILNERLAGVLSDVQNLPCCGVVVVRLNVTSPDGRVDTIEVLSCTLQTIDAGMDRYEAVDAVLEAIDAAFQGPVFAEAVTSAGDGVSVDKPSGIALPLIFD